MKLLLLIFSLLTLSNTYAGDRYLSCGLGDIYTIDEFFGGVLVKENRAIYTFQQNNKEFTVIYDHSLFTVYQTDLHRGGFTKKTILKNKDQLGIKVNSQISCFVQD